MVIRRRAISCRRCRCRAGCGRRAHRGAGALARGRCRHRRSTIGDVTAKEGRTGALCFVAVHHEVSTPRGLALRERHDIVYREATSLPAAATAATVTPEPADLVWEVEASPTLLFRYSALTFNGHRIHYDQPYATVEEGYAGLVVHGPIQATLMLNIAATLAETTTLALDYRGLSPLIAGGRFAVKARRNADGGIRTWTEGADGRCGWRGRRVRFSGRRQPHPYSVGGPPSCPSVAVQVSSVTRPRRISHESWPMARAAAGIGRSVE